MATTVTRGAAAAIAAAGALMIAQSAGGASRAVGTRAGLGRFVGLVQGAGSRQTLGLFSASTGARVKRLGTFGINLSDNGLAVTPGDANVFFTLIPRRGGYLDLLRLDVATGRRQVVARGAQPAIDDAGIELAFMTTGGRVEVRGLHSDARRVLDAGRLLGFTIDPLNSRLIWLADEQTLVMLPAEPATAVSTPTSPALDPARGCRPTRAHWPIVFIHVPPNGGRLTARCRTVRATTRAPAPQPSGATVLASSPWNPSAVWIASDNGLTSTITQVAAAGPAVPIAGLGRGVLPEAIDRTSRHILYIAGHPPALWEATIAGNRLTHRHRLAAHSRFEAAAW